MTWHQTELRTAIVRYISHIMNECSELQFSSKEQQYQMESVKREISYQTGVKPCHIINLIEESKEVS